MNGTPRLRSAFPKSPQATPRQHGTPRGVNAQSPRSIAQINSSLPDIAPLRANAPSSAGPLIPFETIDAPQQRLYVVAFYIALLTWRIYDFHYLQEEQTESLWMFMKWVAIDGMFLFGLPELRIPWLEWSAPTMITIYIAHAILDALLMFRIPLPLGTGLVAFTKLFFDRELAISERHVKHSSVMHNSSLILGKQIVQILPEGSAILNPQRLSFCLEGTKSQIMLPIQINQTDPTEMQLLHVDLDTNQNQTINIAHAQIKKLTKEAQKSVHNHDKGDPLILHYPVKKTGSYALHKAIDGSKLEIGRNSGHDTIIVSCPRAIIKPVKQNKCKGELSNVELEVTGTPPLKIKYRKLINDVEHEASLQSIQPEDFVSPMSQTQSSALMLANHADMTWARQQTISVPVSELLAGSGKWAYSIDQVQDAFGNTVDYSVRDHDKQEKGGALPSLHQVITVHERPTVSLDGCNSRHSLKVARNHDIHLPIKLGSTGKGGVLPGPYKVQYSIAEERDASHDSMTVPKHETVDMQSPLQRPLIRTPGLYTLQSVSTDFCSGEVLEPMSCLLQNPAEPSLRLETEEIFDKCAHKAIGLRVDLHLTGTPPFDVRYIYQRSDAQPSKPQSVAINALRGQVELSPPTEGHYTYRFTEISDATYKSLSLQDQNLVLEQDVKPSAHAHFIGAQKKQEICIDQAVKFNVGLRGEGPFTVEYELVRGNQRKPFKQSDIQTNHFEITTEALTRGGEYTLALVSVTDSMNCKEFLQEETKITVQHQKPKAGFGQIENARSLRTLENKRVALPVRLGGEPPYTMVYRNTRQPDRPVQVELRSPNDRIEVQEEGTYELISVKDRICAGVADEASSRFDVQWVGRPSLSISESSYESRQGDVMMKHDVCEEHEDSVDVHFAGEPPFTVKYTEQYTPHESVKDRKKTVRNRSLTPGLGLAFVRMDTSRAGVVQYRFNELGDAHYDHDAQTFRPVTMQQRIHPRPSVDFVSPGKTYSYCSTEAAGEDVIPIELTGEPPFNIDVEIKHHGTARPVIWNVPDINKKNYNLVIPHSRLHLGTSAISLLKVSDSRGCSRLLDSSKPRVQVSVYDPPSIAPLESQESFCVGDRISFSLSGQPPFQVFYEFNGAARKATSSSTTFRRLAEKPGTYKITGVSDTASSCKANVEITKHIHGMPSVRVSKGRESVVDIHEGGEAEIIFEFEGTPPFEFTWTRSTTERKGHKSTVLEMRSETSHEHSMTVRASEAGTYEVVAIKDAHCSYAREGIDIGKKNKLLTF